MLPQGDDPPTTTVSRDGTFDTNTAHPAPTQEQETCTLNSWTTAPTATPLVKAITTTLSPLEDVPLTFCNRLPLAFRYPGPASPGADHDETIIRMVDDEQSWGDIEALAGEEAFDRYYSVLDPGLKEFWTKNKIAQLNDAVIDHIGRFLKPRAATILKGTDRPWHSKNATDDDDKDRAEVEKVATIYPVVVTAAWMDLFRWEKVARSVDSSPLVCQHIWETFGDGRPYSAEEEHFLDEIMAAAIEKGARISVAIKEAAVRVEAARVKAEKEEEARVEAEKVEAARIQAAKEEAGRVEAARIKAAQDEADRIEAERIEAERLKAAEEEGKRVAADTKRIEANKARAIRRRAKVEATRAEVARVKAARIEAMEVEAMAAAGKRGSSRIQAAKECEAKQHAIIMQENISKEKVTKQEAARKKATRRQAAKEKREDAVTKDRSKRESAALAAARAWDLAVRAGKDRKAKVQVAEAKRQKKAVSAQDGLNQDQNLPLSSNAALGSKRRIESMESFLPPTTLTNQERREPQNDNEIPPTIHPSTSSASFSSLISPAPSPLDESLDFHLSKRARLLFSPESLCGPTVTPTVVTTTTPTPTTTMNAPPSPASLLSSNHNSTSKALSPSHSPSPLPKETESLERIRKLKKMKQVLTDRAQSMVLQCQDRQVETEILLRQRDAAIAAAKARQRGGSDATVHRSDSNALAQVLSGDRHRSSQETTPILTGLPSPVTPTHSSVLLPAQPPVTQSAAQQVVDLTDGPDRPPHHITASTLRQPLLQQDHPPQQQMQPQPLEQQLPNIQQRPLLCQTQPVVVPQQPPKPRGQVLQPTITPTQQAQQMQEYIQQMVQKNRELQRMHQQHQVEKQQLLEKQRQQRHQLAQEQQRLSLQLQTQQQATNQQLRFQVLNQIRQEEDNWKKRHEELSRQEQVLLEKLTGLHQHTQQLQHAITGEQKKLQLSVTPEHVKQLHADQQMRLSASQQQRYNEIQFLPVESQAVMRARLNEVCRIETQTLLAKQKDEESTVTRHIHRQELVKQAVLWLQLRLHDSKEQEKQVQMLNQVLHTQKLDHQRLGITLLQEHEKRQQQLAKDFQSQNAGVPLVGTKMAALTAAPLPQGQLSVQSELSLRQHRERELQRQKQMQQQVDLQQSQDRAVMQYVHALAASLVQDHGTQATAQGQAMAQGQIRMGAQGQAQTQQHFGKDSPSSTIFPTAAVAAIKRPATVPVSMPPQPVSVVQQAVATAQQLAQTVQQPPQQPPHPHPQPQASAVSTTVKHPTPVFGQSSPPGSTPTPTLTTSQSSLPAPEQQQHQQEQHQQPSQESSFSESKSATFSFPNPLYDITEWTAEDKNRLWSTWLEVGDDWEQISTKGLQGKFSADVCCAVILGTAA
ncbi:hypothetical protein BGW39_011765 [Mortierella sp. 14UC]|nr:hypothetical protein BGW39_011765 [Mortierella sp. 14UC]